MSNSDLTSVLLILLLLVALAQLLGYLFREAPSAEVVGEILAGVLLGPAVAGRLPSASRILEATQHQANILNVVYWLGLLLLMFLVRVRKHSNSSVAKSAAKWLASDRWNGYSFLSLGWWWAHG